MSAQLIVLVPLLVLPVILLLAFSGCVSDWGAGEQAGEQTAKQQVRTEHEYPHVVLSDETLKGFWRLNEPRDGKVVAFDSVSQMPMPSGAPAPPAHDGKYKNPHGVKKAEEGPLVNQEPNDKAAEFISADEGYVEIESNGQINPHYFTIEAWIAPSSLVRRAPAGAATEVVAGAYEVDGGGNLIKGFALEVTPTSPPQARIRLGTGAGAPTKLEGPLVGIPGLEEWCHVVATFQAGELNLYVNAGNGVPVGNPAFPPHGRDFVPNTSMPLRLAAGRDESMANSSNPALFFDGRIGDVALYNVAIGGDEIKKHFQDATSPLPA
jgi:hypothetical protein